MRYLTGNYTKYYRDPDSMLQEYKDALPLDLLAQLKRVLNHHNATKFLGHITEEKNRKYRAYVNQALSANSIPKIESTLNKEERNKHVVVFS